MVETNHKLGAAKRKAKFTTAEYSRMMASKARLRMERLSPAQRKAIGRKLTDARKAKKHVDAY